MYNIAHVALVVNDLEASKKFYSEVLGMVQQGSHEDARMEIAYMDSGNGILELLHYFEPGTDRTAGVVDHIAFKVENMDEELERLKKAGVKFILESPKPFKEGCIFFFAGPDGERIEFVQE